MIRFSDHPRFRSGLLSPLQVVDYRKLLGGITLWWQALYMEILVAGWLLLDLTGSAWLVALVTFSLPGVRRFGNGRSEPD